jgi:hypothetical protein
MEHYYSSQEIKRTFNANPALLHTPLTIARRSSYALTCLQEVLGIPGMLLAADVEGKGRRTIFLHLHTKKSDRARFTPVHKLLKTPRSGTEQGSKSQQRPARQPQCTTPSARVAPHCRH